jgi:hypothetical protein
VTNTIEIAKKAYAAYGVSTGNKNFRGEEMPTWDALPEAIRNAWVAATEAVIDFMENEPL